jgi:plasmid maintenance system antidote protein VapI
VRAIGIRLIGKEANHWEEQFFLGLSEDAQIDYGQDPNSAELFGEELRRAASVHSLRRISEVSGIARNSLSLIAKGQIAITPVLVERLIRAMTTLDQVASEQAEFEQKVRDGLSAEIAQRGLRNVAKSIGIDASNLRKMVSWKRKLTPGRLVE